MKKRLRQFLFLFLVLAACKDDDLPTNDTNQNPGYYKIALQVLQGADASTWKYTIIKNDAIDLDNFIIDFNSCGAVSPTIANIISVKVNGVDWSGNITSTKGSTSCEVTSTNFVKFDNLVSATQYVIEFTLDAQYSEVNSTGWITTGNVCVSQTLSVPGCKKDYVLTSSMQGDASVAGKNYNEINTYMKNVGFDYSEHPNCSGGYGAHAEAVHCDTDQDASLNKAAFRFDIHIDPVIDGDRCSSSTVDRQRNEMKSVTNNSTWAKVQGNWDEWQVLEWKFKLPKGFQPTTSFCHLHQLKAQDGPNNGAPLMTLTARANSDGSNSRIQIIHTVDGATTDKGTIVDNISLSEFEDEWVQVREEMHYTHQGYYSCKITRIRDGKILIDFKDTEIDMWPGGSSYVRHKYGIYRSLGNGRLNQVPVGQNPLLKNESLWITDFNVYEKNTNPDPSTPHN